MREAAISPRAAISLGSNIAPERHLLQAAARLEQAGRILAVSQAYSSAAVGPPGRPDFVNAAVLIETDRSPEELRRLLRRIEADLGRVRVEDKFAPRPIDLDLALYDNLVEQAAEMTLPDPDLLVRPYLAATVAELDPEAFHPVTGERMADIAARLGTAGLTPRPDIDLRGAG